MQGAKVDAFVECAVWSGTITEKADGYLVFAAKLAAEGRPGGDGQTAANDAVGAQVAEVEIGDVHRTALAAAVAGSLAEELGHHQIQPTAFSDAVAVTAVGGGDVVGVGQGSADASTGGFFADVEVQSATHAGRLKGAIGGLLEAPDAGHRPVHPFEHLFAGKFGSLRRASGPGARRFRFSGRHLDCSYLRVPRCHYYDF